MKLPIENPMIRKELRPLLLPWSCALAVGTLFALKPLVEGLDLLFKGLVFYGFLAGQALVCALSFGEEFQHRTIGLLLSHPLPRSRVWKRKTIIVSVLVLLAVVFECFWLIGVSSWYPGREMTEAVIYSFTGEELALAAVFLVATVCSCGYWTLLAQSTIGGLVFTVSAQLISALAVGLVVGRPWRSTELVESSDTFPALLVGGLLYSAIFLWLGRRKFLQFEIKGLQGVTTGISRRNLLRGSTDRSGLKSTPNARLLNLVRKEVLLLKPVFQLAAVFVLSWFGILVLQLLRPRYPISWLFDWLICLYAPLAALLGGCLTLGEEKALGVVDTQLTLPLSRSVQWLVKFLSCFCTTSILILGLPVLLFWFTGSFVDISQSGLIGLDREIGRSAIGLSLFSGIVFCLAFWAITQVPSTVQATLLVIVTGLVFFLLAAFGLWAGENYQKAFFGPLVDLMCRFHNSPDTMAGWCRSSTGKLGWGAVLMVLLILLYQSLQQFRRPTPIIGKLARNGALLASLILLASFLVANLSNVSGNFGGSKPVQELRSAVYAIAANDIDPSTGRTRVIPPEALLGRVSDQTLGWLKSSQVSYQLTSVRYQRAGETGTGYAGYIVSVLFPDGVTYVFDGGLPLMKPH